MIDEGIKEFIAGEFSKRFPQKPFIPGQTPIPVSGKIFDATELEYATSAVLEGWWTEGKWVPLLEKKIAEFVGVKFCSMVNSGSSANLVAFAALTSHLLGERRLKPGDEVITVAASFPTTINPIILYGCVPVLLDIDATTLEIDVDQLELAYTPKVKAIFVAHTLGNTFNVKAIKAFCEKYKLWLIEDNCDALGSEYDGKRTGSFGHISTISFYPAHHITTAEGGAVLTNDHLLNKIILSIRDWGRDCWCPTGKENTCCMRFKWNVGKLPFGYDHKYIYSHIGYNLKMTDMQAALGVAQMEKLPAFVQKRRENYQKQRISLGNFNDYFDFVEATPNSVPSWFGFVMTVKKSAPFRRTDLMNYLNENKIGTRQIFAGNITKQPYFINSEVKYRTINDLHNSDRVMEDSFWIGLYPGITDEMIAYTKDVFTRFIKSYK